jgi:hypothetical protein
MTGFLLTKPLSKPGGYNRQHKAEYAKPEGRTHPEAAPERSQSYNSGQQSQAARHKQYPHGNGYQCQQHSRHDF